MDALQPPGSPSVHTHKHQLAWQILVPFLIVVGLVIIVAVLVATEAGPSLNQTWSDISIIWLIAPTLIFSVFIIFLLGFLIYGIARLMQVTPHYTGRIQDFFALLSGRTRSFTDGIVKPFVWFQQVGAILKSIFKL
jgi:hypothetical protein